MALATLFLNRLGASAPDESDLLNRLAWQRDVVRPRLERYLGYYRNTTTELATLLPCGMATQFATRPFRQFQEIGLPTRITGFRCASDGSASAVSNLEAGRKEVVIENDIAWRIDTLVDFAAGRAPGITSTARDPALRGKLTTARARCGCCRRWCWRGASTGRRMCRFVLRQRFCRAWEDRPAAMGRRQPLRNRQRRGCVYRW